MIDIKLIKYIFNKDNEFDTKLKAYRYKLLINGSISHEQFLFFFNESNIVIFKFFLFRINSFNIFDIDIKAIDNYILFLEKFYFDYINFASNSNLLFEFIFKIEGLLCKLSVNHDVNLLPLSLNNKNFEFLFQTLFFDRYNLLFYFKSKNNIELNDWLKSNKDEFIRINFNFYKFLSNKNLEIFFELNVSIKDHFIFKPLRLRFFIFLLLRSNELLLQKWLINNKDELVDLMKNTMPLISNDDFIKIYEDILIYFYYLYDIHKLSKNSLDIIFFHTLDLFLELEFLSFHINKTKLIEFR